MHYDGHVIAINSILSTSFFQHYYHHQQILAHILCIIDVTILIIDSNTWITLRTLLKPHIKDGNCNFFDEKGSCHVPSFPFMLFPSFKQRIDNIMNKYFHTNYLHILQNNTENRTRNEQEK